MREAPELPDRLVRKQDKGRATSLKAREIAGDFVTHPDARGPKWPTESEGLANTPPQGSVCSSPSARAPFQAAAFVRNECGMACGSTGVAAVAQPLVDGLLPHLVAPSHAPGAGAVVLFRHVGEVEHEADVLPVQHCLDPPDCVFQ